MKKKLILTFILTTILALILSACGSTGSASSMAATEIGVIQETAVVNTEQALPPAQEVQPGIRLALGTLSLQGTDLAVTSEQASVLLPLWEKLASAAGNGVQPDASPSADVQAALEAIQAQMTAGQMEAIQALDISGEKLFEAVQSLGLSLSDQLQAYPAPDGQAGGTPPARQGNQPGPQGTPPSAQGIPSGPQGTPPAGGPAGGDGSGARPAPFGAGGPGGSGGFETAIYQAVISLLESKSP